MVWYSDIGHASFVFREHRIDFLQIQQCGQLSLLCTVLLDFTGFRIIQFSQHSLFYGNMEENISCKLHIVNTGCMALVPEEYFEFARILLQYKDKQTKVNMAH